MKYLKMGLSMIEFSALHCPSMSVTVCATPACQAQQCLPHPQNSHDLTQCYLYQFPQINDLLKGCILALAEYIAAVVQ